MSKKQQMIGRGVKEKHSATSRSSKCNDRQRRKLKRAERDEVRRDVRDGKYNSVLFYDQMKGG